MFKQVEYSEILFKNSPRKFNRCSRHEGSTYNDHLHARPSGKVIQQVVIFVNASKNTFSIQQSLILQFYCFIASINLRQQ